MRRWQREPILSPGSVTNGAELFRRQIPDIRHY
jgi:hypothetical protein